ncbi:MAG TPA: hypothetical protein VN740_04820 [Solirubrobacteraceae bacterium]|nr:hypothetical protein [Solirubrobacteraceae bacterium]
MHLDEILVRGPLVPESIDPHGAHAGGARPGDVVGEAVADHHRIRRVGAERLERMGEDRRVGLADPDLARHGDGGEAIGEARRDELLALQVRRAVGHEPERVVGREVVERRCDVIERLVQAPPLDAVALAELLRERGVVDALAREGAPPGFAPVRGRPRAQPCDARVLALETAPQRLPRADLDRLAVGMDGRRPPQLAGVLPCGRRERGRVELPGAGGVLRGRPEGGRGGGLVGDERVVEVEEQRGRHSGGRSG